MENVNGRADRIFICRIVRQVTGNVELAVRDCRRDGFTSDIESRGIPIGFQINGDDRVGKTVCDIRNMSGEFHIGRGMSDGVFLFEFQVGTQHGQRAVKTAARDINFVVVQLDAVCAAVEVNLRGNGSVGIQLDDPSAGLVGSVDTPVRVHGNGRGGNIVFRRNPRFQRGSDVVRSGFRLAAGCGHEQKNRREQQIPFCFHKFISINYKYASTFPTQSCR